MKLTAIFLLAFCMQISANGYSQKVTLSRKNASLEKVFREIKKQTGYAFFFDESWIRGASSVTLDVKEEALERVLAICFSNQPLTYSIVGKTIVVKQKEAAQTLTAFAEVRGVVADSLGQRLAGVTVRVKGTTRGTTTGVNGEFSIEAKAGDVLQFSFVGYAAKEVTVGESTTLNVRLSEDSRMLDNVVVTALGISKKDRKLGYALTTVKGEEVQRANTISPITALQGKVAGLNINVMGASGVQSSPSIIIRGAKSLNKNNQPIFVIDGMVIETNTYDADGVDQGSQLKNLNPDDYESITVLKGAAATSFYGTRGANGAIVITSKKGQPGQGLGVTFNSTYQTQVIYRNGLPLQDVYGSGAIAFREGNFKPDGTQVATSFSFGPRMDGSMHPSVYDPAKLVPYSPQPNNWKTFFQNGAYINNNVALSGGSENVTYRFSYSNLRNDGTLPNNQVKRNNFDFRTTGRINNVFSVEAGANNYSVFYPSANLSWAFTDTWRDAMPQWLSFGKLRASLAYVGKGTGAYETSFGSYTQGTVINADGASVVTASLQNANVLPNMNLKAELQRSIELGTNLSFLNDMVNFDFAWYRTNTFNQILRIPYVVETGYTQRLINAGNIQNQGIEVLLNVTPIRTKDLRWDMSVNFTRNRGKIIEFYPGIKQYEMMGDYDGAGVWAYEGGDFGVLTANASYRKRDPKTGLPILRVGPRDTSTDPETKHDFQTYSWVNSVFNADTPRVNIGRVEPNFLAGWNTNLRWKDLSLYVQLDARFGGYSYSEAYNYGMQRGNLLNTMKYRDQANGGVERTDTYTGQPVFDGAIPDAIFEAGQKSPINGKDIGGMTFREAYDAGLVEPWKAGNYYINTFGWGRYLDNGSVSEVSWVMLREVSLGYQLPRQLINKIHLKGAGLRFTARNLGYLYNGLEGGQNPESLQSNNPFNPMITGAVPFSRNYAVSINISL